LYYSEVIYDPEVGGTGGTMMRNRGNVQRHGDVVCYTRTVYDPTIYEYIIERCCKFPGDETHICVNETYSKDYIYFEDFLVNDEWEEYW